MLLEVSLRGQVFKLKVLLVLVAEGPGKGLLRGLAQGNSQDVVDLLQALLFLVAQLLNRVAKGGHAA